MLMPQSQSTPLYVEQYGQGRDVVLIHGWGLHGGIWRSLTQALKAQFRFHLVDLPGHGYSKTGRDGFDLDTAVAMLRQTLRELDLNQAVLVGWSLGGMIGWRLALSEPKWVSRMVLVAASPSFVRRPHWAYGMSVDELNVFADQLQQDYRATVLRFLALQAQGDEQARHNVRHLRQVVFERGEPSLAALASGLDVLRTTDLTADVHSTVPPTLLIAGQRDVLVSSQALQAAAARLGTADLKVIRGAGHAPFLSHCDDFNRYLCEFIQHAD